MKALRLTGCLCFQAESLDKPIIIKIETNKLVVYKPNIANEQSYSIPQRVQTEVDQYQTR